MAQSQSRMVANVADIRSELTALLEELDKDEKDAH